MYMYFVVGHNYSKTITELLHELSSIFAQLEMLQKYYMAKNWLD